MLEHQLGHTRFLIFFSTSFSRAADKTSRGGRVEPPAAKTVNSRYVSNRIVRRYVSTAAHNAVIQSLCRRIRCGCWTRVNAFQSQYNNCRSSLAMPRTFSKDPVNTVTKIQNQRPTLQTRSFEQVMVCKCFRSNHTSRTEIHDRQPNLVVLTLWGNFVPWPQLAYAGDGYSFCS